MPLFKAQNLCLSYDGTNAVTGLDFEVSRGDYMCVVGENGSGKSTLIKALLGLKKPSSGILAVGDGLKQNQIGYLPQQTKAQKDFPASVYEVVMSGNLGSKGLFSFYTAEDKRKAAENMEKLGITELRDKCYRNLSGGQQQRTAIARTLVMKPDVILFDEPMAALDAENRLTLRDEIKKLQHSFDSTILYVTHDQEEAFALSDRIMVLEQGRIHQLDAPENLLHHPADSYVEQFVGQNLLRRLRDLQQYTNMAEEQ